MPPGTQNHAVQYIIYFSRADNLFVTFSLRSVVDGTDRDWRLGLLALTARVLNQQPPFRVFTARSLALLVDE